MGLLSGTHLGLATCVGKVSAGELVVEFQCCWTGPRSSSSEDRIVTGLMTSVTRERVVAVQSVVLELMDKIASHFHKSVGDLGYYRPTMILHVHLESLYEIEEGSYYMGAIFISLVSLIVGRRARSDTAIYGDISPTGTFSYGGEWTRGEVECCRRMGIRRVVMGAQVKVSRAAQALADTRQEDGRPLVELRQEAFISKALQHCFD